MKYELTSDKWNIPKGSIFMPAEEIPVAIGKMFIGEHVVYDKKGAICFSLLSSRMDDHPDLKPLN